MPSPVNKELYEKIKKQIYLKYPKHSAYRSGLLVKEYKKQGGTYTGNKKTSNLKRWFDEKWTNQRGKVGYKQKGDIYRPTIRINNKTPTTFNELTKIQIEKAKQEKKKTGKVKKFNVLR